MICIHVLGSMGCINKCCRCIRCIYIVFNMYCASISCVLWNWMWMYVEPLPECTSSSSPAASFHSATFKRPGTPTSLLLTRLCGPLTNFLWCISSNGPMFDTFPYSVILVPSWKHLCIFSDKQIYFALAVSGFLIFEVLKCISAVAHAEQRLCAQTMCHSASLSLRGGAALFWRGRSWCVLDCSNEG